MGKKAKVIFALGGPGTGKGTGCSYISSKYEFIHISAGDLLRAEIKKKSKHGKFIHSVIKDGSIVPVEITVNLLLRDIHYHMCNGKYLFLIDGFPRNQDNYDGWEKQAKEETDLIGVLLFECSEGEMEKRICERGKSSNRVDDNIESIKKRIVTFKKQSVPIVDYYREKGICYKIDTEGTIEDSRQQIDSIFEEHLKSKCM